MNDVINAILERRSIRSYSPEQISDEHLRLILEAGLWAPTARNEQEIQFVVIQDKNILEDMQRDFSIIMNDPDKNFSYEAPTFIILFGPKDFIFSDVDAGIAVQSMAIAAQSLGLGSVIVGIIRVLLENPAGQKYFDMFGIPDDYKYIIGLAVVHKAAETPKRDRKEGRIKKF